MNLVTIIIDTLRYDHIAANGNSEMSTPNLDRFAAKSWNFHRAFAASFPTIPHRTDVITGRYGAPFHPWKCLDPAVATIPRSLAELGYCSQLIHDTPHLVNGGHSFDYPFDAWMPIRGAEVDRAWFTDSWKYFDHWKHDPLFDGHNLGSREDILRTHHALTCYVQTNWHREKPEDWNTAKLFLTASRFLRDNKSRDNFFLWIDCFDPHEPWDAPPEFMKLYDKTPDYDGSIDPRAFHVRNASDLSAAARKRTDAMYKAKVSHLDKWFGTFLDTLEETGLDRNTAVLLTADHGTNLGDRDGRYGKAAPPVENEAHVPFLLSIPDAGSGQSEALVQPQDIFATLLGIADGSTSLPEGVESHSLLNIVRDDGEGARTIALSGTAVGNWRRAGNTGVLFSAFDGDWRLGFTADPEHCELQALGSQEDVASEHPEVVEQLHSAALEEMRHRDLDPALMTWLEHRGKRDFPAQFRVTDATPAPEGWRAGYWNSLVSSLGKS